jgi:hypothetical protein
MKPYFCQVNNHDTHGLEIALPTEEDTLGYAIKEN